MMNWLNNAHILTLAAAIFSCHSRQIIGPIYNPDCPETTDCSAIKNFPNSRNNLVSFQNSGGSSRLHFFLTTIDQLSILLIETTPYAHVDLIWDNFWNASAPDRWDISIDNGSVEHSFALEVSKLYRYNDVLDRADISYGQNIEVIPIEKVMWQNPKFENGTFSLKISSSIDGENSKFFGPNGSVLISFDLFDHDGLATLSPHLLFNDRAAQFEIELKHLNSRNLTQVRYALEISLIAHHRNDGSKLDIKTTSTINDEYTPGIFETHVMSNLFDDAYLLWKPVCYYNTDRERSSLSRVSHGYLQEIQSSQFKFTSLLGAFYRKNLTNLDIRSFNVSFGMPKDKFYTDYSVWTLQLGFGAPPKETFSTLITLMIILCLATPCGAIFGGGFYGLRRRLMKKHEN